MRRPTCGVCRKPIDRAARPTSPYCGEACRHEADEAKVKKQARRAQRAESVVLHLVADHPELAADPAVARLLARPELATHEETPWSRGSSALSWMTAATNERPKPPSEATRPNGRA